MNEIDYQKPLDALVQHPENVTRSRTSVSEDEFRQYLQSIGLLTLNGSLVTAVQADRTPISIKGKPLSETVLEERRLKLVT